MIPAGAVAWCDLDPPTGSEQGGRRPVVVISSSDFTDVMTDRVIVVPCTTRDREWANHVALAGETGLTSQTFAMTEQPRTISVKRIHRVSGHLDPECLRTVCAWVHQWIYSDPPLPSPGAAPQI